MRQHGHGWSRSLNGPLQHVTWRSARNWQQRVRAKATVVWARLSARRMRGYCQRASPMCEIANHREFLTELRSFPWQAYVGLVAARKGCVQRKPWMAHAAPTTFAPSWQQNVLKVVSLVLVREWAEQIVSVRLEDVNANAYVATTTATPSIPAWRGKSRKPSASAAQLCEAPAGASPPSRQPPRRRCAFSQVCPAVNTGHRNGSAD